MLNHIPEDKLQIRIKNNNTIKSNQNMSKLILSRKNDFLFRSVEVGIDNDAPRTLQPNGVLELELSNSIHSVSACIDGFCSKIDIDLTSGDRTFIIKRNISRSFRIVGISFVVLLYLLTLFNIISLFVGLAILFILTTFVVIKCKKKCFIFIEV